MFGDGARKDLRNFVECLVPPNLLAPDYRVEEAALQPDGLAEMRSFRAKLAPVGRMSFVARNLDRPFAGGRRLDAAAHSAIGAGGADRGHQAACLTTAARAISTRPE